MPIIENDNEKDYYYLYEIKTKIKQINSFFVVANDPLIAWNKVKDHLDINDIGFDRDRRVETIKVIAETAISFYDTTNDHVLIT